MTHRGQGNEQATPADGQPWAQSWGSPDDGMGGHPRSAYPEHQDQYGQQDGYGPQAQAGYDDGSAYGYGANGSYGGGAQPLPAEAPPGSAEATQFLPSLPVGGDGDATQFIAPFPQQQGQGSDAQPTQFIAPVPAQDPPTPTPGYGAAPGLEEEELRQPPAEFDSLFRSEGASRGGRMQPARPVGQVSQVGQPAPPAPQYGESTQQFPQYEGQHRPQGYDTPPPSGPAGGRGGSGGGRRKQPLILVAAVAAVAVVGLGVGALMSGGGDDSRQNAPVGASSPVSSASGGAAAAADPAEAQAKALDALLADSNSSRESVIGAVGDIKSCKNLDGAATDLRNAAKQRRGLVEKLKGVAVDKLPDHAALSASLTSGWQASASADDHYADWAGEAKSRKVCRKGSARHTSSASQGDRSSGQATTAKTRAAELWNVVATKYDLKQRSSTDL